MQQATILLVEGKNAGVASYAPDITKVGHRVLIATTGKEAIELAQACNPDLVVFDASKMRSSGARSCRRLRTIIGDTPLIHCLNEEHEKDHSAEADVYLQQPFTYRKLNNRIKNLLPADELTEEIVRLGNITLFLSKKSVSVNGVEQRVTPKLIHMLEEFMRHANEVVTRKQLMENVWETSYVGDTRTLDVHIRWARECIEENPGKPKLLTTVRGKGYILKVPIA